MSGQGAEAVLYDIDGDAMAVENGTVIPAATSSLISAGSDGTNARFIKVTSDGYQLIVGAGFPGVPYGGVITIQGDPLGTPIPISGNITASNASVSANDAAIPGFSTLIGGSDGTNLRPARIFDLDTGGGTQWILGVGLRKASGGGSVEFGTSSDPIRIDPTGTTIQPISGTVTANQGGSWTVSGTGDFTVVQPTASNLRAQLASETTIGIAIPSTAVQVGGSDGVNLRPFFTDSSGRQIIIGAAANGAAVAGNPVLIAGSDGTNARSIRTATDGTVRVDPTGTTIQPVSGTVTSNQGTSPWVENVSQFGGSNVVTGTGTSGAGIPRVTVSNDSNILATQSGTWTVQPGNTANTTPWLTTISQGGNSATVTASNALKVDGSAVTQPVSSTQLPGALVGGRLDTNIGAWLGSTAPTVGQKTMANSVPMVIASDQTAIPASQSGTWTVQQGTPPWSFNQTQINGSAVTVLTAGEQKVAVEGLAADGAAVSGNPVLTAGFDGTNVQTKLTDTSGRAIVVGAAADGAAVTGNPVLMGGQDGTNVQSITTDTVGNVYTVDYGAPSNSLRGVSFGRIIGQANTLQAVRATTYVQQSSNAQRSVSSGSASDTSAGAGARQVLITYYTATMTGPFTETVTLNGTTPVNTSNTNICFIEKMEVVSVGSNLSNVGIISLFVSTGGGGGTIGTISINNIANGRGDNQTIWAHHYVASGITMNLTSFMAGTNTNQGATTFIMNVDPTVTTSAEKMITDSIVFSANTSSVVRNFVVPLRIPGPARITLYVVPNGSNTPFFGGFNFWEL